MVKEMRTLRNFVRFWFGLQALGFVVSMLSLGVLMLVPERFQSFGLDRTMIFPLIAAGIVMIIFDGTSGVAWWMLRKGKPSARYWAIAASLLNLPFPVISHLRISNVMAGFAHVPEAWAGTVIGIAGLIAYWSKNSTAQAAIRTPAAKRVRIAGDGTSNFADYLGQGVSIGIVWISLAFWSAWATNHHLIYPDMLSFFVQMQFAILLTTFGHELGHLFAGWACGKILRSFQVGPFRWEVRNGAWRFAFNLRKFYGGSVGMAAPDLKNMRSRKAFSLMGGPVASLVMGSIFIVATLATPGRAWQDYWMFLSMVATFSLSGFVVNLIPVKPESLYSDGAQLYQVLTNGPWARVHFAFAMVTTSMVSAVRPRDFDVSLINKAAASVPTGERGLLLRLFACLHYVDANRIPEAIVSMRKAEDLYADSHFEKPQDICAEFVFVNAFYKHDLAAAEQWVRRIADLSKVDLDADYWRAQTALHWLKGDREEAREAWERGHALALELPAAGSYDFTRACFAKLRRALDLPVETVPPPLESLLALAAICNSAEMLVAVGA
jgi:hypothetical protein